MMFMRKPQEEAPAPLPPRLTEAQAAAALRAKEVELAARALEEQAAFEREKREAERAAWRAEKDAKEAEAKAVQTRTRWSTVVARVVPYLPLVLVNVMAVMGQFGWGRSNLDQIGSSPDHPARMTVALLFAGALESLALFQGYYADKALQRGDSAAGLYAGAFGTAAVVAGLNYSHYAAETTTKVLGVTIPEPTATAVVFALFSFISPALWRIHSRATNRDRLKAAGEIDARAVRLSWSRKLWHPVKSIRTMYWATWEGVATPAEAVELYERRRTEAKARRAEKVQEPEESAGKRLPRAQDPEDKPDPDPQEGAAPIVARRFPEAWAAYMASARGGNPLTQRALAKDYLNGNRHHARDIIAAWKELGEVESSDHDARSEAA